MSTTTSRSTTSARGRTLGITVPKLGGSASAARGPCSPITNDPPKSATSESMMKRFNPFRGQSPAPAPKPTRKEKPVDPMLLDSSFAREVALLQLLDGGSTARAVARVQAARAKRTGAAGVTGGAVRGPRGELFEDAADEEAHRGLMRAGYKGQRAGPGAPRDDDDTPESASDDEMPAPAPRAHYQHRPVAQDARTAFFADTFAPRRK